MGESMNMTASISKALCYVLLLLAVTQVHAQTDVQDRLVNAIRSGDRTAVRSLLHAGASANQPASNGFSPLVMAVLLGSDSAKTGDALDIIKQLLAARADLYQEGPSGQVPFNVACGHTRNVEIVEFLIGIGADVNRRAYNATTPLYQAVRMQRAAIAHVLVKHGADVKAKDSSGVTALHYAALNGMKDTAELLLARGADINARDSEGKTPLSWAQGNILSGDMTDILPVPMPVLITLLMQRGGTE